MLKAGKVVSSQKDSASGILGWFLKVLVLFPNRSFLFGGLMIYPAVQIVVHLHFNWDSPKWLLHSDDLLCLLWMKELQKKYTLHSNVLLCLLLTEEGQLQSSLQQPEHRQAACSPGNKIDTIVEQSWDKITDLPQVNRVSALMLVLFGEAYFPWFCYSLFNKPYSSCQVARFRYPVTFMM